MNNSVSPRFAVIGNPVAHSRSPSIHRLFGEQTGIRLSYERIEAPTERFESVVRAFFAEGGCGLNVTVPFKQEAWKLAHQNLSERAGQAQAVNTLWMHGGSLHGCNTDGPGLVDDLKRLDAIPAHGDILLVGAGGAARGVIGPLLQAGTGRLHVVNRSAQRAADLVGWWVARNPSLRTRLSAGGLADAARAQGWDLVVNASSSSLGDTPPDLPGGLYASGALAYDMMYRATPTPFMEQATRDGANRTSDGLGMLVAQAAVSFLIWHGVKPDITPVLQTIRAELQASTHLTRTP